MHRLRPLSAHVHGRFAIVTADGVEVVVKGAKERALLAMLILSPGQSKPRAWLQDRLWSLSPPGRGAVNLRRVLSNIRRALGPHSSYFHTDRSTVRLNPEITIIDDDRAGGTLLGDVDGQDPEFDDWLTLVRAHDPPEIAASTAPWIKRQARQASRIRVESDLLATSRATRFAAETLACRIASRLTTLGPVEIELAYEPDVNDQPHGDGPDTLIRIQGAPAGDELQFRARIQRLPSLQYCGSHRATVPSDAVGRSDNAALSGLINRTVMTVLDVNAPMGRDRPYYAIQNAVRRIYSGGDPAGLVPAEALLKGAQKGEAAGIALAWRAFLRLTDCLEFRGDDPALAEEAVSMSREATRLAPRNAIVWALAGQIAIYLTNDFERGMYYARRAAECADDDPYTLDALSSAASVTNDRARAFELAERGRKAAEGLDNVYNWDMQCCLSALYVGRLADARSYAQECHWKMPLYRPALRYLVALNLLAGNREAADEFSRRLQNIEPDFRPEMICGSDYPVHTLRNIGLVGQVETALGA